MWREGWLRLPNLILNLILTRLKPCPLGLLRHYWSLSPGRKMVEFFFFFGCSPLRFASLMCAIRNARGEGGVVAEEGAVGRGRI